MELNATTIVLLLANRAIQPLRETLGETGNTETGLNCEIQAFSFPLFGGLLRGI